MTKTKNKKIEVLAICSANLKSELGLELLQAQNWTEQT